MQISRNLTLISHELLWGFLNFSTDLIHYYESFAYEMYLSSCYLSKEKLIIFETWYISCHFAHLSRFAFQAAFLPVLMSEMPYSLLW